MATKYIVTKQVNYYRAYIPSARSQKYAFDRIEDHIKVAVPSVTGQEAPVAIRLHDFNSKNDQHDELRWYGGKLWQQRVDHVRLENGNYETRGHLEAELLAGIMPLHVRGDISTTREVCQKALRQEAQQFLIIDGTIWEQAGEPRYVVCTFGLGHNHGGTGLMVTSHYNDNIPNTNYFSALDGDAAVAHATKIAERRGDTESLGKFTKDIEVLIPEAVTIRPLQEHGEGDEFMNKIEAITEAAPDATTAGLLALMTLK